MSSIGDQELVVQLQGGSLEALGELYDRHQRMVFHTALAITGDREAANDLLQDVFLRLYRYAGRINCDRPLEPWLYRMTANLSYTWVTTSHRWLQPLEEFTDWLVSGGKNGLHDQFEKIDESKRVQQAISALPLNQRVVVVLYYLNDLSLQEISEILDVPVGTVKSRLHYGRQALKRSLGLQGDQLPDLNYESP